MDFRKTCYILIRKRESPKKYNSRNGMKGCVKRDNTIYWIENDLLGELKESLSPFTIEIDRDRSCGDTRH
jgi:hypothetical protein